jgi:hypothetical protein
MLAWKRTSGEMSVGPNVLRVMVVRLLLPQPARSVHIRIKGNQ